ncbi:SfmH family fimbriae-like adhesin protein [Trabulsiella guamensis ATCC 49490]|uniref:SfmH family fimbriae-like adhesin protein n=1 Tax=Trabulsiella guamensis ATCC 49490 TaxID=1005994 RepID=A0A085ASH5_9ENTR|nr:fimbrial protein [Trabulsiella guamensis]KFC13170.1 SfmH family fimbriae-like adhesin protein [Trabulsiella guamensis ATCC 49490]
MMIPIPHILIATLFMLCSVSAPAATILRNCFAAPGTYQATIDHELSASENSTGKTVTLDGHQVGAGQSIIAQCDCPGTMTASSTVMGFTFAGSPLSAGSRAGYGYLTENIDIDIDAYTDAIHSPDGSGLYSIAIDNYPTTVPVRSNESLTSKESNETVCRSGTQPVTGVPSRQFKWNVLSTRLYIKSPILGQESIPATLVEQSSACLYFGSGMCNSGDAQPVANIWLSGSLSAPLSCTINAGSTIDVDFGAIARSNFTAAGVPPTGFTLKAVDINFHCDNAAVSNYQKIKLTLTADQGVSDPSDGLIAKMTGRDDIGVRMFDANSNNVSLDGSVAFPVVLDSQGNGSIKMQATPVATTATPPSAGPFEGNVTVKLDLR